MTRMGGVPYWPADLDWPQDEAGDPMQFIAQFCFLDSHDLGLPALPGEILSVFVTTNEDGYRNVLYPEAIWCEWLSAELTYPLDPDAAPKFKMPLRSLYGVRHRTLDFDVLQPDDDVPEDLWDAWCCGILEGTKIGGLPFWPQQPEPMEGTFLGSIGSVSIGPNNYWPFVNVERIQYDLTTGHSSSCQFLMIGDLGLINLFLNDDGTVGVSTACG